MTERAKYWATQLAAWERSGLTQAEYCRRRRIKAGSFAWWKRQLLGAARARPTRPADRPKRSAKASKQRGRPTKLRERAKQRGRPTKLRERAKRRGWPTKLPERVKRRALRVKRRALRAKGRTPSAKLSAPFVELPWASAFPASTYELVLAGGRSIRIPSQFDPDALARLISVVESC